MKRTTSHLVPGKSQPSFWCTFGAMAEAISSMLTFSLGLKWMRSKDMSDMGVVIDSRVLSARAQQHWEVVTPKQIVLK